MVYLYNGILFGHEQEENVTLCNGMDRPGEYYDKWNRPVRERKIPHDFTHLWKLGQRPLSISSCSTFYN